MTVKQIITYDEELEITEATLLTAEEAERLPKRLREYESWWWLKSPGGHQNRAAFVYNSGSVIYFGTYVDDYSYVRPSLKIQNLESSNLKIGDIFIFHDKKFEIVNETIAFCLDDIGRYCFREGIKEIDENQYEKSDVKKYVEEWFSGNL